MASKCAPSCAKSSSSRLCTWPTSSSGKYPLATPAWLVARITKIPARFSLLMAEAAPGMSFKRSRWLTYPTSSVTVPSRLKHCFSHFCSVTESSSYSVKSLESFILFCVRFQDLPDCGLSNSKAYCLLSDPVFAEGRWLYILEQEMLPLS